MQTIHEFIQEITPIFTAKLQEYLASRHARYIACSHHDEPNDCDYSIILTTRRDELDDAQEFFREIFVRKLDFQNKIIASIYIYDHNIYPYIQNSCSAHRTDAYLFCKYASKTMPKQQQSTRREDFLRK